MKVSAAMFRKKGYSQASLEDIADELGMWKGSLYNYISCKEDLLAAVVKVPSERLISVVRSIALSDHTPEQKLRAAVDCHIDVLVDIYDFAAVYLHEVSRPSRTDEWRDADSEYLRIVESIIADGVRDGSFRNDANPRIIAMTLTGALNWLTRWWDPAGELTRVAVTTQICDLVLCGLLTTADTTGKP